MQNAPKRAPFSTQKLKHFLGGGMASSRDPSCSGDGKHQNNAQQSVQF